MRSVITFTAISRTALHFSACLALAGCLNRTPNRIDAEGYGGSDSLGTSLQVARAKLLANLDSLLVSPSLGSFCSDLVCDSDPHVCAAMDLLGDDGKAAVGAYLSDPEVAVELRSRIANTALVISDKPIYVDGKQKDAATALGPSGPIYLHRDSVGDHSLAWLARVIAHEAGHKTKDQNGNYNEDEVFLDVLGACLAAHAFSAGSVASPPNPDTGATTSSSSSSATAIDPTCSLTLEEDRVRLTVNGDAVAAVIGDKVVDPVLGGHVDLDPRQPRSIEGYVIGLSGTRVACGGSPLAFTPRKCGGSVTVHTGSVPGCWLNFMPPKPDITFNVPEMFAVDTQTFRISASITFLVLPCHFQCEPIVVECRNGVPRPRKRTVDYSSSSPSGTAIQTLSVSDWQNVTVRQ